MKTLKELISHADGADCKCCAAAQVECSCDVDWTPREIYKLRWKVKLLKQRISELEILAKNK